MKHKQGKIAFKGYTVQGQGQNAFIPPKNFRKENKNNMKCILNCSENEDHRHVFKHCKSVLDHINNIPNVLYEDIFCSLQEETQVTKAFMHVDKTTKHIIKNHLFFGGG